MTSAGNVLRTLAQKVKSIAEDTQQKQPELFGQYLIGLEALWLGLKKSDAEIAADPVLIRIKGLMTASLEQNDDWDSKWRSAWQAEQLMAAYLNSADLVVEAERRLFDAERLKMHSASHFAEKWKEAKADTNEPTRTPVQRALYADILGDLHWLYGKRSLDRKMRSRLSATVRKVAIWLLLFAVLPFLPWFGGKNIGSFLFESAQETVRAHLFGLYTAISFGILGALFSRLIYFQSNYTALEYDELVNMFQSRALSIRLLVGTIGAIIVFYAILGNFLSGDLFPKLAELKFEPARAPDGNFAKLVIWCFLGGFSERLVPDFLTRTEAAASKPK